MRIKTIIGILVLIAFAAINVEPAFSKDEEMLEKMAADEELQQEFKWLKAETYVITASKVMETIKKAPSSIKVVTDRQIRQMGARAIWDVIKAVPGFGEFRYYHGQYLFGSRGDFGPNSILVMINSHPINNAQTGSATLVHDTLIIDNIKRIEFIRGPGSALYGANAYHGVINIITKEAEDIDGFELTARGGSWDTQQYNLLYGKTFGDLEVTFNLNYFKTHGHRAFIEEDLQTYFDGLWAPAGVPPASLAPGRTNGGDEKYDVALNLKFKGFTFDGRYVDREREYPFGFYPVLNEESIHSPEDYYLNLSYETAIMEGLDLSGKIYRNHLDNPNDQQFFPPGFTTLTPNPTPPPAGIRATWEEGVLGGNSLKASRTGIEIQSTYKISDSNTVVAGAIYEEQKMDNSSWANSSIDPDTGLPIKHPSVQRLPDTSDKRNFKAFFLEDIWDITDDIRFTTGVRYDRYSDFGDEVSPRVGLTWEYIKGYDLKLLYGHAFRAPTFDEILWSDPSSELDLETVDTYEVSLGADFTSSFSGRLTLYHKEEEDIILAPLPAAPWNWVNQGKSRSQGFEVEAKYDFGKGTYISGYLDYHSDKSGDFISYNYEYLMANVRLSRYLNFHSDCRFFDPPKSLSNTLVSATLIAKKFLKGYEKLELRGSVYNLFDKDLSIPVSEDVPNGWPQPGINYLLEMRYTF